MTYSKYNLKPNDSQKSFYGKAIVYANDNFEFLRSYDTAVIRKDKDGSLHRLGNDQTATATTLRHIKAYCGLNKEEYLALPCEG